MSFPDHYGDYQDFHFLQWPPARNKPKIPVTHPYVTLDISSILLSPKVASPALAINERVKMLREQGEKILMCGFGESPFPPPTCLQSEMKNHVGDGAYWPTQGIKPLREAVSTWIEQRHGVISPEDCVIITPGAKMAIYLLVAAIDAEVLLPVPCWVSYRPMCEVLGRKFSLINTKFEDGWKLTPELLEETCKNKTGPKVMILNTPHNPTGAVYTEKDLLALVPVMRRHNITLISDEIYASFELQQDVAHVSPAQPHIYPNTIVVSGLSKVYGVGGWRLGFMALPKNMKKLVAPCNALASISYSLASVPVQKAALKFYRNPEEAFAYRQICRAILGQVGITCHKIMSDAGINVCPADGAYYLYVDFDPFRSKMAKRGINTGAQMCDAILAEAGCAMLPGTAFEQPDSALTARFCFVDFDGKKALEAAEIEARRADADSKESPRLLTQRTDRLFSSGPIGENTSSVFWSPSEKWILEYAPGPLEASEKLAQWVAKLT